MDGQKNTNYQISLPLVLCIGLAAGLLIGASINSKSPRKSDSSEIEKLREVLSLVQNEYVDKGKTDVVVEDAINHILGKLDPHSAYIPAREKVEANERASVLNLVFFTTRWLFLLLLGVARLKL